jgi:hypothetical protein
MSQRKVRARKRVKVKYDSDPDEGDTSLDITIARTPAARFIRSSTVVGKSEAGTTDSTDPWTRGFFDEKNSEAFVVDSLPDDLQDFILPNLHPDRDEKLKDLPKVLALIRHFARLLTTMLFKEADSPTESWKAFDRSIYLDELLRHDGRAGESSCSFCEDGNGLYKCKECFGGRLHCQACIVKQHLSHPLHRIEVGAYTRADVLT